MQIVLEEENSGVQPCVATIGCFDGVHLGHRFLIDQVKQTAKTHGLASMLITFNNMPQTVLHPETKVERLTLPNEKMKLLEATGVDYCCNLTFTLKLGSLSAKEFMQNYLSRKLHVKYLVIGYDHHFGRPTGDGFEDYCRYGQECGIEVVKAQAFEPENLNYRVSSSSVRQCLSRGDVANASRLLGRYYTIEGNVVSGRQIGHSLGFPTANLNPTEVQKMLPADGCYAVAVNVGNEKRIYPGMLYIGRRPTFNDNPARSIEVNVLHFEGNLYGTSLKISFIDRLRGEQKFDSPEQLAQQLQRDLKHTEQAVSHLLS